MGFFKKKEVRDVERILEKVQSNLENNYKDMAKSMLKDAEQLFRQNIEAGVYTEKEQNKLGELVTEYQRKIRGNDHTDMSKFLYGVQTQAR